MISAQDAPGVELIRSLPTLKDEFDCAAVSVSQCGYNTAIELVASGVPAIVVPFALGREDEQRNRAHRLAARGILQVVEPEAS